MSYLFEKLLHHRGHSIECVSYGDWDEPADVCIECTDCNEVLISAQDLDESSVRDHGTKFILREAEDPKIVYGILCIDSDIDAMTVQAGIFSAKEKIRQNDCWEISDVLDLLPEDWAARIEYLDSDIYI